MAKLSPEITENLWNIKRNVLEIVEEAKATEYLLFNAFGEAETTLSYLDEMKNVAEEAETSYIRLFRLHLQLAKIHPIPSDDLIELVQQAILKTPIRIFAWRRSIQEVQQEWNLE